MFGRIEYVECEWVELVLWGVVYFVGFGFFCGGRGMFVCDGVEWCGEDYVVEVGDGVGVCCYW